MRQAKRHGLALVVALSVALAAAGATAAASGPTGNSGPTGGSGPTGPSGATGATSKPRVVACPAGVASVSGPDQWVWSAYGKPSSSSTPVSYSQSGGNGSWNNGEAKGTICSKDQGGGAPTRSIVLSVSGASKLTPHTTRLGLLGVAIVLPVTVSKSGDPVVCPVGTTGTVSLFASYYSVHHDKASLSFTGTCTAWNETFTGSILHVKISHNGAMIR